MCGECCLIQVSCKKYEVFRRVECLLRWKGVASLALTNESSHLTNCMIYRVMVTMTNTAVTLVVSVQGVSVSVYGIVWHGQCGRWRGKCRRERGERQGAARAQATCYFYVTISLCVCLDVWRVGGWGGRVHRMEGRGVWGSEKRVKSMRSKGGVE